MKYHLAFNHPTEKRIEVTLTSQGAAEPVQLFLPRWRPGRYELQRFDRNISDVQALGEDGRPLPLRRVNSHQWEVVAPAGETFRLHYFYYANKLDAGGSFFDHRWVYVNGINLLMYRKELIEEPCELSLDLPSPAYQVACGLSRRGVGFWAKDFHQLVDAPLLASESLQHHVFDVMGVRTHLWFLGDARPDMFQLERDIRRYSEAQIRLFGDFPADSYHYLFILRPDAARHGVEHFNSTVISMGPDYRFRQEDFYRSFLEICSHELFHTWNVKEIRPQDMSPYDYDRECYSELHYITEGVTTYYGDLMIWKGGGWSLAQWLESLNHSLARHYFRGGKDEVSLTQASFESWVNGYRSDGTPNRQISFYTKGYLVTFLLDVAIREATQNEASFDEVMYRLYHEFGRKGKAYTAEDIQELLAAVSGRDFSEFFKRYVSGTDPLEPALAAAGQYMGLELSQQAFDSLVLSFWGFSWKPDDRGRVIVDNVYPNSPALAAGISQGDEIVALDGRKVGVNLEKVMLHLGPNEEVEVHFFHQRQLQKAHIRRGDFFWSRPQFALQANPSPEQLENLQAWQKVVDRSQIVSKR
jgi:predicted metalloprotease with PDZ domain